MSAKKQAPKKVSHGGPKRSKKGAGTAKLTQISTETPRHISPPKRPSRRGGPGGREDAISKHPAFLEHLAKSDNVVASCKFSGLPWPTAFRHRLEIPSFAAAWDDARHQAKQEAHGELYQRGVVGWDEPVYQGGEMVGTIRLKSDKCLTYYLEHNFPEIYCNKLKADINGKIELTDEDVVERGRAATAGILSALAASVKGTQA
jgi:hypothetical protein